MKLATGSGVLVPLFVTVGLGLAWLVRDAVDLDVWRRLVPLPLGLFAAAAATSVAHLIARTRAPEYEFDPVTKEFLGERSRDHVLGAPLPVAVALLVVGGGAAALAGSGRSAAAEEPVASTEVDGTAATTGESAPAAVLDPTLEGLDPSAQGLEQALLLEPRASD